MSQADDGAYQATISAQPLPPSSAPGTIVCAPNSAKYCTGNAAQLTWQGHTFAFEPADVNNQQAGGNYSIVLDGKDASCGNTLGQWTGYELAIDTKGQLHLRINPTAATPSWAEYDNTGSDTCFTNYGETPPIL
jgi:hypothetical protein